MCSSIPQVMSFMDDTAMVSLETKQFVSFQLFLGFHGNQSPYRTRLTPHSPPLPSHPSSPMRFTHTGTHRRPSHIPLPHFSHPRVLHTQVLHPSLGSLTQWSTYPGGASYGSYRAHTRHVSDSPTASHLISYTI